MSTTTPEGVRIDKWRAKSLATELAIIKGQSQVKERLLKELLEPRLTAWLRWKELHREYASNEFRFYQVSDEGIEFYTPDMPVAGGYREEFYMTLTWDWIENPERVKIETGDRRALYEELKKEFGDA